MLELNCECNFCGKSFHVKPFHLKRFKTHYCSKECQIKAKSIYMSGKGNHQYGLKGKANGTWKSDRRKSSRGYWMIRVLEHPLRTKDDFVLEHRLVAEKYLLNVENSIEINGKRYLSPNYIVHHINENKTDNRPENLVVMKKSEHQSYHATKSPHKRNALGQFV